MLATRCDVASSLVSRAFGLMPRSGLRDGEGLLLPGTGSITMLFMRFPIDAVFLDRSGRVVRVVENLRPWVPAVAANGVASVLELPAGTAARTGTQAGDELSTEPAAW